ncbi:MAG TPA: hypothetical protein VFL98_02470 [Candidatus Paceibacterota bacterium]|nr:hypothetical protein [Candidatus Paceibacterota bacterium]
MDQSALATLDLIARTHGVLYVAGIVWTAFCFAHVEIAIEGKDGWAGKLPTWRLSPKNPISRLLFGGRPADGYHVWMDLFILSMLHIVYAFVPYSLATELELFAFLCFFTVLEDFFWFVFNPAFGLRNFRKEKIWWHRKQWLWIAPSDYYFLLSLGAILYAAAQALPGGIM